MFNQGRLHTLRAFITELRPTDAWPHSNLIPILIMQRWRRKYKGLHGQTILEPFETLDTPQYIWIEKGTRLTPQMVFEKVRISIRNSLSEVRTQDEFDEKIAKDINGQDMLSFGTTMNLDNLAESFTDQEPFSVQFEFQKHLACLLDLTYFE
jgi:hypothetical protein